MFIIFVSMATELPESQRFYKNTAISKQIILLLQTKICILYTTKEALCAQKHFTSIFSTPSYSDIALIDKFDLIFFYFNFVFEIFGNNSVLTP